MPSYIGSTSRSRRTWCARRIYHIEEFGVDSDFRRRGVGSALIGFCRSEAARTGFGRISLDVWSFNESALKFYESLGFRTSRSYMEADVCLPCRSASRRNRRGAYPLRCAPRFYYPFREERPTGGTYAVRSLPPSSNLSRAGRSPLNTHEKSGDNRIKFRPW